MQECELLNVGHIRVIKLKYLIVKIVRT